MTLDQIEELGITLDSWASLKGLCRGLIFTNEDHIFANSDTSRYYFDSGNKIIYVKHISFNDRTTVQPSKGKYITEVIDGVTYYIPVIVGGLNHKNNAIGIYHTAYDMNRLVGMF